jgi:hypothetical protein
MVFNLIKSKSSSPIEVLKKVLITVPDAQTSAIAPVNVKTVPTKRLVDLVAQAIPIAFDVDHSDIARDMKESPHWPLIWPGEHYRLLTALVKVLQPKLVIEIGTANGYSGLAMKKALPDDGSIVTFDIVPWNDLSTTVLKKEHFAQGKLKQVVTDLTNPQIFKQHEDLLSKADFVFIDAAKDGHMEQIFINHFKTIKFVNKPIFMFDDIRVINMIEIWNNLDLPKWDISSLGHWAGTGLVDWTAGNKV